MGYAEITIPENKKPNTYTHMERRAEILRMILDAGHPKALHRTSLAKRYGVSNGQITHDVDAIRDEIVKGIDSDFEFVMRVVYEKAIKTAAVSSKVQDNVAAAKMLKDWGDFLFDAGYRKRAPSEIHVESKEITPSTFQEVYEQHYGRDKRQKVSGKGNKKKGRSKHN